MRNKYLKYMKNILNLLNNCKFMKNILHYEKYMKFVKHVFIPPMKNISIPSKINIVLIIFI